MKIRSIHRLNNRIRNYLCLFLTIFIASSLCFTLLFFWYVSKEVDNKASTWANYLVERISFLETVVTSRATFDHGMSILRVTPDGEVVNSRPFPLEIKSVADSLIFQEVKNFTPGQSILMRQPDGNCGQIYLIQRLDHSFAIAKVPSESLLPVSPHNTELQIRDRVGNCIFNSENRDFQDSYKLGKLHFSNFHVFSSAKIKVTDFGGFSLTVGKDISTEFYAGLLLILFTAACLGILVKRSAFLTWDLEKNEKDFIRINNLLKKVSASPDEKSTYLPAIEATARKIREVDWDTEARRMSFIENRNYIAATAFFSGKILKLLDEVASHSQQLTQSKQEYHDLVHTARSIILRIDRNGICTFFNEYAQTFFGYSEEEIIGRSVIGTLIPETADGQSELEQLVRDLTDCPECFPVNTNRNIRKDGSCVWVYWTNNPVFDDEGKLIEILCVGTDITERKKMEIELQDTRNYIRNIIDSMPSVVIGLDNDSRITHFNKAAQRLAVVPKGEIEGSEVEEAFPPLTKYAYSITQAIETGIPETGIRTQGMTTPNSYQDIIIYPLNDGMKGAVIRIDDATERVQIDEMMIQTEKMMSIGGLAAGMAHEINNPLGGILQGIQNIIRRVSPDLPANLKAAEKAGCSIDSIVNYMEDRKIIKTLNGITDSGVRAASIVSGMLEFSRKSDSHKAPGDLRKIMDKAATLAAQDYNPQKGYDFKKITITKDYDENLSMAPCTTTEIEQVFLNLLRNSAQAMNDWKDMGKDPEISIKISNERNMVKCTVADNGPGMDENVRKRVFEPFYTTKGPGSGTGLGLSVSYFIITQNHRGVFQVDSSPGMGTTFTIQLPSLKN
ncbi:PAS domain S-box protein [Desulfovibrio sp. JC010]|uniref:PAS domain-containing sensor histidine kinase n=1 Tax=Desulfovibrio sp. JC010 TaxID=2593641 RepID=UPI0013D533D6|nr:PAS domain S-box protein [Desulfovibrio sp. JC010]NDV25069.1 PAS domain S-box protein [Desulfovibrio sp. JC010]